MKFGVPKSSPTLWMDGKWGSRNPSLESLYRAAPSNRFNHPTYATAPLCPLALKSGNVLAFAPWKGGRLGRFGGWKKMMFDFKPWTYCIPLFSSFYVPMFVFQNVGFFFGRVFVTFYSEQGNKLATYIEEVWFHGVLISLDNKKHQAYISKEWVWE